MTQAIPSVDAHLRTEVKRFLVSQLRLKDVPPESIGDEEPLAEGRLGLDSIDFLELTVALEKHYGIRITEPEEAERVFASISSLAGRIARHRDRPAGDAG
jgi:acyl carrier protein